MEKRENIITDKIFSEETKIAQNKLMEALKEYKERVIQERLVKAVAVDSIDYYTKLIQKMDENCYENPVILKSQFMKESALLQIKYINTLQKYLEEVQKFLEGEGMKKFLEDNMK